MSCKECSQSVIPVAAIKKGASIEAKAVIYKIENMHTNLEKNMKRIEDILTENIVKEIDIIKAKLEESKCSQVEIIKRNISTDYGGTV